MLTLIDEPLLPVLVAGATGELQSDRRSGLDRDRLVGVVMASRGYPGIRGHPGRLIKR